MRKQLRYALYPFVLLAIFCGRVVVADAYSDANASKLQQSWIQTTGFDLGTRIRANNTEAGNRSDYYAMRITGDINAPGYNADIIFLGSQSALASKTELRILIAAYLAGSWQLDNKDASELAAKIIAYNESHRGNIAYFDSRYKKQVTEMLTANAAGLDSNSATWPGNTMILVPLEASYLPRQSQDTAMVTDNHSPALVTHALSGAPDLVTTRSEPPNTAALEKDASLKLHTASNGTVSALPNAGQAAGSNDVYATRMFKVGLSVRNELVKLDMATGYVTIKVPGVNVAPATLMQNNSFLIGLASLPDSHGELRLVRFDKPNLAIGRVAHITPRLTNAILWNEDFIYCVAGSILYKLDMELTVLVQSEVNVFPSTAINLVGNNIVVQDSWGSFVCLAADSLVLQPRNSIKAKQLPNVVAATNRSQL